MKFMPNKLSLEQKIGAYQQLADKRAKPPAFKKLFPGKALAGCDANPFQTMKVRVASVAETVVKNVHDMICLVDLNGKITYASDSYWEHLGYSDKDLIGTNAFDLTHPDDREAAMRAFSMGMKT